MTYTIRMIWGALRAWAADPRTRTNRFLGPMLCPRRYPGP